MASPIIFGMIRGVGGAPLELGFVGCFSCRCSQGV